MAGGLAIKSHTDNLDSISFRFLVSYNAMKIVRNLKAKGPLKLFLVLNVYKSHPKVCLMDISHAAEFPSFLILTEWWPSEVRLG